MLKKLMLKILLPLFTLSIAFMAVNGWVVYYESGFKGKVIDAETKEPIEGVLVAATYVVSVRAILDWGSAVVDVQETLTDSNGEYNIPANIFFYLSPFARDKSYPTFVVFKPGYESYPGNYSFCIYPISHSSKKEGIIYDKIIKDKEERKKYNEKFKGSYSPFILLRNPSERIRKLDIPFDVDVMNAESVFTTRKEQFETYPVIGLSKIKTLEERTKSYHGVGSIPQGFENKAPILRKFINDEYKFLTKRRH